MIPQHESTVPLAPAPTENTFPIEEEVNNEPQTEPETVPEEPTTESNDNDLVRIQDYIPDIIVELRYATENNFTGQQIYDFTDAYLRYGTVKKLILVQDELRQKGLSLKVWDGFRPVSAQFKLWEVYPDATYVANPNTGFSSHSRGNTIDLTLAYLDGTELEMPTGFDDFSKKADRNYSDCNDTAAANAQLLENIMTKYEFKPYFNEWWHFSDTQSYDVEKTFEPNISMTHHLTD